MIGNGSTSQLTRRDLIHFGAASLCAASVPAVSARNRSNGPVVRETYETQAKGIRIFPGSWRPCAQTIRFHFTVSGCHSAAPIRWIKTTCARSRE